MRKRSLSILTTLALLPAAVLLFAHRSLLSFVYLASFCVTLVYHASAETEFRRTDHALAYGVIAANTWMAFHSSDQVWPGLGITLVIAALVAYGDARMNESRYDSSHAIWHLLCGAAGLCFAVGYTR